MVKIHAGWAEIAKIHRAVHEQSHQTGRRWLEYDEWDRIFAICREMDHAAAIPAFMLRPIVFDMRRIKNAQEAGLTACEAWYNKRKFMALQAFRQHRQERVEMKRKAEDRAKSRSFRAPIRARDDAPAYKKNALLGW